MIPLFRLISGPSALSCPNDTSIRTTLLVPALFLVRMTTLFRLPSGPSTLSCSNSTFNRTQSCASGLVVRLTSSSSFNQLLHAKRLTAPAVSLNLTSFQTNGHQRHLVQGRCSRGRLIFRLVLQCRCLHPGVLLSERPRLLVLRLGT
jgi:hypothetical protein